MDIDDDHEINTIMQPAGPSDDPPPSEVEVALAGLFGCSVQDVRSDGGRDDGKSHGASEGLYCLVLGCARCRGRRPAWISKDALRVYIDLHCLGEL